MVAKKIKVMTLVFWSGLMLTTVCGQVADTAKKELPEKSALKFNLNESGSKYFQVTFCNQTWLRWTESNEGTTQFGKSAPSTFDIGLRRTRIQMFGQITDRTFIYFQYGQNNFNAAYTNAATNRKFAAFFHDAVCEFKTTKDPKNNVLKLGAGLTVASGLSRFSQPGISSVMTLDVPVTLQYTVDQTDQFNRRLAVYARGQIKKLDYRFYMANSFPVASNGSAAPAIGKNAAFVNTNGIANGKGPGITNQYGGYLSWNFFEMEPHNTPYMAGTYLGKRKVWNISVGGVYQNSATWYLSPDTSGAFTDTTYANMVLLSVETFLDLPLNKEKETAISAFAGFYRTDYGLNYLRYNGLMNPATGSTATNLVASNAFGNSFPMFGTGQVAYAQVGFLMPRKLLGEGNGQLMPFVSVQYADYEALKHKKMILIDAGLNWLIKGHNSKISINYQNRPTFYKDTNGDVQNGSRKSCVILQYQIFI